ncbi:Hsp20 family protein [Peribacillus sp. NPDC097295]|uniref:Hsp20 family protein n=1 Tax=Peribacillus sp. NPDC097295 TaxID=3364402 RepID=UPI0038190BFE
MQDKLHEVQMNEVKIFDDWVKKFFLNPETSILDHQLFTIDIYESNDEYMVEAILENHDAKDIKICLRDNEISILVDKPHKPFQKLLRKDKAVTPPAQRKISFPFSICARRITAEFTQPLLVIRIHKYSPGRATDDIRIE